MEALWCSECSALHQAANPGDYVGLEQFVESIGGEFAISTNATGPTTAEGAEQALAENATVPEGDLLAAAGTLPRILSRRL